VVDDHLFSSARADEMVIVLLDDRLVVAHAIVLVDHGHVLGFDHCGNRHAGNRRGSDREN
jgi:hypothetical protein